MKRLNPIIKYVGISIQLYKEIQDDYSPTREHTPAINCYCKSIQKDNIEKCNQFDVEAKIYYFENIYNKKIKYENNELNPMLCSCHADVTNLLFLFNPSEVSKYENYTYKNEGINIYIFIGHFLLNKFPYLKVVENKIDLFDNVDGYNFNNIKELFIMEKEAEDYKDPRFEIGAYYSEKKQYNCHGIISNVDYNTIMEAKEQIQSRLTDFLINHKYLEIDKQTIIVADKLIKINDTPSLKVISENLRIIDKQIKGLESIKSKNRNEYLGIKNEIAKKIKKAKALLYKIRKETENSNYSGEIDNIYKDQKILEIHNFIVKGLKGDIGKTKWIKEGRELIKNNKK